MDTQKKPEPLTPVGKKAETRGRKPSPEGPRVRKNISIRPEIWDAAQHHFKGEVSPMIEAFLAESVKGKRKRNEKK